MGYHAEVASPEYHTAFQNVIMTIIPCTRKFFLMLAALGLFVLILTIITFSSEQKNQSRKTVTINSFHYLADYKRSDPPVLAYRNSRGHHGQWIADSDIKEIFIWKDGTVVWKVAPKEKRWNPHWYQSHVSAEKVATAVQEIATSFGKYPIKNRPRWSGIWFNLGTSFSPRISVHDSLHYESLTMDISLMEFYKENRKIFQAGNDKAIVAMMKTMDGRTDYKGLVSYYSKSQGFRALVPIYNNRTILQTAARYAADVEHLLLMEEKILELLPSHDGLEARESNASKEYEFHVEQEIKEGKSEFFYTLLSEEESEEIWQEIRKRRFWEN